MKLETASIFVRKEVLKMSKQIHVVPNDGKWKLKQDGASRSSGNFDKQSDAIQRAIEIAKRQQEEVTIHGRDGRIRQKNSYGNDPYPPEG